MNNSNFHQPGQDLVDNEEKLRETLPLSSGDAYVLFAFSRVMEDPDISQNDHAEFLASLSSPSDPDGAKAFEKFHHTILDAETFITRGGYTYEESALMLGLYLPDGLAQSCYHQAQSTIEGIWTGLFLRESPTSQRPQSDLRSLLGVMRALGMVRNGLNKVEHQHFVERLGRTISVYGEFFLPLKPLDPKWEHDPTYLRTQIEFWEAYLMQGNIKHKQRIGSTSPAPRILKPTDEELHEAQMLCLYKLLEIPLNGNREEALNSGTFPGWFIEIANREGYLMMPSLATLEISVGQGRDELVAMWPKAFQQWLKDRSLFHRTPKPVKATPAWASPERLNPETMTTNDKRALAWREFDAAQAAKDKE